MLRDHRRPLDEAQGGGGGGNKSFICCVVLACMHIYMYMDACICALLMACIIGVFTVYSVAHSIIRS